MQKFTKRLIAFAACMVMVLSMAITSFAASEVVREDGFSSIDGLEIKTTTDSEEYKAGEAVKYTINVKNTNDYALDDVYITYSLTDGIDMEALELKKYENVGYLDAGESKTIEITTNGDPHSDFNIVIVGIIAAVVVVVLILVIVIVVLKKKKKNSITSMILVGAMLAGSMSMGLGTSAEAAVTNSDFAYAGVHDPSIVKDPETGTYYVFGTHKAAAKSDDLMKWKSFQTNIATQYDDLFGDVWENFVATDGQKLADNLWAPDVIWNETMGKWCMYMSVNGADWHSAIVLLTADDIEGPYEYVDEVIFSGINGATEGTVTKSTIKADKTVQYDGAEEKLTMTVTFAPYSEAVSRVDFSDIRKVLGLSDTESVPGRYTDTGQACVNAIDPNVQYDDEGNLWMTYGSWSAGIYQIKLDTKTGLRDYNYTEYGDFVKDKTDPYLGYKIAGGYYNSGEGPYLLKTDDYYYLFISLGNLETDGGYNMRIFRSENISGPYVDQDGNSAIYTAYDAKAGFVDRNKTTTTKKYNSLRGIRVMSSIRMYGKSKTHVEAAQGHNSAFVDDDGKIYLVYHTRYTDTGEAFSDRVHQMYVNEDGWLVVSPYDYSGETYTATPYTDIAGTYDLSIQLRDDVYTSRATTTDKGIYDAVSVTLGADGTISGSATGTWKLTNGNNVEMVIDGTTYKGVFVKQANETERAETLTFTLCGGNQMVWGAKTSN